MAFLKGFRLASDEERRQGDDISRSWLMDPKNIIFYKCETRMSDGNWKKGNREYEINGDLK